MVVGLLSVLMPISVSHAESQPNAEPRQNIEVIRTKVKDFLTTQSMGSPGKVEIMVGQIDPNLKLVSCPNMEAFLPAGSMVWGKTSVGLRCGGQAAWTIYVQASVSVYADYLVAVNPLAQGQVVSEQDVMFQRGDLTRLPPGIYTDLSQVLGRTVKISLTAGSVLRQEMLKIPPVVQQGQAVTLTSAGRGFRVSAEGQALANAVDGQIVQVKVASGQVVSGVARAGGVIEVGIQ